MRLMWVRQTSFKRDAVKVGLIMFLCLFQRFPEALNKLILGSLSSNENGNCFQTVQTFKIFKKDRRIAKTKMRAYSSSWEVAVLLDEYLLDHVWISDYQNGQMTFVDAKGKHNTYFRSTCWVRELVKGVPVNFSVLRRPMSESRWVALL